MSTQSNIDLVPKEDLQRLDELNKKLSDLDSRITSTLPTIYKFGEAFAAGAGSMKDAAKQMQEFDKLTEQINATYKERNKIQAEAAAVTAKVTAQDSAQVKQAKELQTQVSATAKARKEAAKAAELEARVAEAIRKGIEEENAEREKSVEWTDEQVKAAEDAAQRRMDAQAAELDATRQYWEQVGGAQSEAAGEQERTAEAADAAQLAFDSLSESIQMQSQNLVELKLEQKEVRDQVKQLNKDYEDGKVSQDDYILRAAELSTLEGDLATAIKNTSDTIKYEKQIMTSAVGSYKSITAQNSLLIREIDKLSDAEGENIERKKELEEQSKKLRDEMSRLKKAQGNHTLDVGKYDIAVADLTKTVSLLDPTLGAIVRKIQNVSGVKKLWLGVNTQLQKSLGVTAKTATLLQGAIIGLIAGAIMLLINAYKKWKEQQEEIAAFNKELANSMRDVESMAAKNGANELTRLKLLYSATQDSNRSNSERMRIAKELQKMYPTTLGNLSQEEILAGKAAAAYNELSKAIINKAKADAYLAKITENESKLIDLRRQLVDESEEYTNAQLRLNSAYRDARKLSGDAGDAAMQMAYSREERVSDLADAMSKTTEKIFAIEQNTKDLFESMNKSVDLTSLLNGYTSGNKELDARVKALLKLSEAEAKAIKQYEEWVIAQDAAKQKQIVSDEKAAYEARTAALDEYVKRQKKLIEEQAKNQSDSLINSVLSDDKNEITDPVKAREAVLNQITLIEKKAEAETKKIDEEYAKMRISIAEDEADRIVTARTNAVVAANAEIDKEESEKQTELVQRYADGLISAQQYEDERTELVRTYSQKRFDAEKEYLEQLLVELKELGVPEEELNKVRQKLADENLSYQSYVNDALQKDTDDKNKKIEAAEKMLTQQIRQMYAGMYNFLDTLANAFFQNQLSKLDALSEENDKYYDDQIARIEGLEESGAISAEQAEARKAAVDEQRTASEEELEERRKEILKNQAKYQKASAAMETIVNTAVAVMAAWKNPYAAPALVPTIIATGAAQLATILAQPLPEYAQGTADSGKAGLAVTGDGGRHELVYANGEFFKTPKTPTVTYLPAHSMVFPDYEKALLQFAVPSLPPRADNDRAMSLGEVSALLRTGNSLTQRGNYALLQQLTGANSAARETSNFGNLKKR